MSGIHAGCGALRLLLRTLSAHESMGGNARNAPRLVFDLLLNVPRSLHGSSLRDSSRPIFGSKQSIWSPQSLL